MLHLATGAMSVPHQSIAEPIRVAVASNFKDAAKSIARRFQAVNDHRVTLIFGSTGKQYAQIRNGAPFHAFLAADALRPERLERESVAVPGSRFTYAVGKLVLWTPSTDFGSFDSGILARGEFRHLAIANPKLAPYGKAAQEVLQALGLWERLSARLVRGENIAQTFQFVRSGNAQIGFVAYSQLQGPGKQIEGSFWAVPPALYGPLRQQAVLLKDHELAREFLSFLRTDEALSIIRAYGYDTP